MIANHSFAIFSSRHFQQFQIQGNEERGETRNFFYLQLGSKLGDGVILRATTNELLVSWFFSCFLVYSLQECQNDHITGTMFSELRETTTCCLKMQQRNNPLQL